MTRLLTALLVVAGVSAVGVMSSAAQSSEEALVKVPFRFIAGDKLMPAGTYKVAGATGDWAVVLVSSVDGKLVAKVRSKASSPEIVASMEPRLWFTNYYGQYFLRQLAMPGLVPRIVPLTKEDAVRTLTKLNLMHAEAAEPAR